MMFLERHTTSRCIITHLPCYPESSALDEPSTEAFPTASKSGSDLTNRDFPAQAQSQSSRSCASRSGEIPRTQGYCQVSQIITSPFSRSGPASSSRDLLYANAIAWTVRKRIKAVSAIIFEFGRSLVFQPTFWYEFIRSLELFFVQEHGSVRDADDSL